MGNTKENLQEAFAGESQASRRYQYFAEKADKEGKPQIARLFRAASEAETVHARNHLDVMSGIGTTADNLKVAIQGENYEFTRMYPDFIDTAKIESNARGEISFSWANKVEKIHHGLYEQALKDLNEGKKFTDEPYYVCQRCGNTVAGQAPDKCPVCGASRSMFKKME
jgi:rubrerythrin